MQIYPYLSPRTKLNLIEENVGNRLKHICTGRNFMNSIPVAVQTLRISIDKCNLMNLKSSVRQRTLSIGQISNLQIGEKKLQ